MNDGPRFLTSAEVAAIFRVPVETVRWWRFSGRGPRSFRVPGGRRVLYDAQDVEDFIRTAREGDGPAPVARAGR